MAMDLTGRKDNPLIEVPITAGPKHDPLLAHWQAGLGKVAVYTGDAFNRWDANWIGTRHVREILVAGGARRVALADLTGFRNGR